jgi:hypothetical protein
MARQRVRIVRDAEEQPALFLGQQLSACHRLLLVPKPSAMIVDGGPLLDAFCGRKRAGRSASAGRVQRTFLWGTAWGTF